MKYLHLLFLSLLIPFSQALVAAAEFETDQNPDCVWQSAFTSPQHQGTYPAGEDVYVRIDPQKYEDIEYMDLYVNGKLMRRETSYPFEWANEPGTSDPYLRKLQPGVYQLKCMIKDKCGKLHQIYCTIYVKRAPMNMATCNRNAYFKYPKNESGFEEGDDVRVEVDPQKKEDIEYMELHMNGRLVRRINTYPFQWGTVDGVLKDMKAGTYQLWCRVMDKCGKVNELFSTFYVKKEDELNPQCQYNAWFGDPQNGSSYNPGADVYVRVDASNYQLINYVELYINGKFVRKETSYPYEWAKGSGSSDSYLRNLQPGTYQLKARIAGQCETIIERSTTIHVKGGQKEGAPEGTPGGTQELCKSKAWFKYPQNNGNYSIGSDVYVRIDPEKYQDIAYMELYINGKFVRKESAYPFEWCKGSGNSDSYLRNLQAGTYKLKARVYDKCGKYQEYYCTIYVGNGQGGEVQEMCKYKSWFKYPRNNGTYRYGSDVYVRVDVEKYQDIEKIDLYVNDNLVRSESSYPFEWCKGSGNSDSALRNLRRGTYNLKARVKTKCGQWYEYFCKFYVR